MINEDWWPDSLSHIPREQPWDGDNVIVAEIRSYNYESHTGYRRLFSALIPTSEIEEVSASLAKLSHEVETSGQHPYFSRGDPYRPSFWVRGVDLPSEKYEPLVLSWTSHDKTVLHPDPG